MQEGQFNYLQRYKNSMVLAFIVFIVGIGSLAIGVVGTAYLSAILGNIIVMLSPLICQHFYTRWIHFPRALERIKTFVHLTFCILVINSLINVAQLVFIIIAYNYFSTSNDCHIQDDYAYCRKNADDNWEKSDYTMTQMRLLMISLGLSLLSTFLMLFLIIRLSTDIKKVIVQQNLLMAGDLDQNFSQPAQTHVVERVVFGQPVQQQSNMQIQNQYLPYQQQNQQIYVNQQSQYGIINPGEQAPNNPEPNTTSNLGPTEPIVYNTVPMQNFANNNSN